MVLLAEHLIAAPAPSSGVDATPMERAKADLDRLLALRSTVRELEGVAVDDGVLRTDPTLAGLLPGGGLHAGGVYSVQGSTSVVMALLAGPSTAGAWCAVVGMPGFGVEAAVRFGIDLGRLVLVPRPGDRWFAVTAALVDAVGMVVTVPEGRVSEAEAARLAARLRQRRGALVVCGEWPRVDARWTARPGTWSGVGRGDGYLRERTLDVIAESRSWGRPRWRRIGLPAGGGVRTVSQGVPAASSLTSLPSISEPSRSAPSRRVSSLRGTA